MNIVFLRVFVRTLNGCLLFLFILSVLIIFSMDMWLLNIDAPCRLMVALGRFNYGIAVSYVAAFIFYLITVHYGETKSAISAYQAACFPAKAIVGNIEYIFTDMSKKLGEEITRSELSEDVIKNILKRTKCIGDSTVAKYSSLTSEQNEYKSWIEYLQDKEATISDFFKKLYPIYPKLDAEYIKELSILEQDNALFAIPRMVGVAAMSKKCDISSMCFNNGLDTFLIELYQKSQDLEKVINIRNSTYYIDIE